MPKKTSSAVPAAPKDQPEQIKEDNPPAVLKQPSHARTKGFRRSEMVEVRWTQELEIDDTFEDCLRPDFWTHVADRITTMSHITVINKLRGWEGELRVLQVANKMVKVVPLSHTIWESVFISDDAERLKKRYRVQSRADGWRVIDTDGNQMIAGLGSEKEAEAFIDQLVHNIAA